MNVHLDLSVISVGSRLSESSFSLSRSTQKSESPDESLGTETLLKCYLPAGEKEFVAKTINYYQHLNILLFPSVFILKRFSFLLLRHHV